MGALAGAGFDARAIVGMVAVALHFLFPKIFILTLSFSLALAL